MAEIPFKAAPPKEQGNRVLLRLKGMVGRGPKKEPSPEGSIVKIRRESLVQQETTDTTKEYVHISEELRGEYSLFLKSYLSNLNHLRLQPDPANPADFPRRTLLDAILENPNHAHDRELLSLFTKEQYDDQGRFVDKEDGVIDETKINNFLKTSKGLEIANQLLEYQNTLKIFALGLNASLRPRGNRNNLAETQSVHTGLDQGDLNKLFTEMSRRLNSRVRDVGGRRNPGVMFGNMRWWQAGTPLAALTGGLGLAAVANPAIGGTALAAELIGAAAIYSSRGGVMLDLRRCGAAFQQIRANPVEAAYLKAVASIDVNDLVNPLGTNTITEAGGTAAPGTMRNVEKLKTEVLHNIETRLKFIEALGESPETDALPSQAQYWDTSGRGQPEQTGIHYQLRVKAEFDRLGGHVAPTTPVNIQQNISRYVEAERKVLTRDIQEYIRNQQETNFQAQELSAKDQAKVTTLTNKREALQSNGSIRTAREREFTERRTLYTESRDALQSERDTRLQPYNAAVNTLQRLREETQRDFGVSDIAEIDTQIETRENNLSIATAGPPSSIMYEEADIETQKDAYKNPLIAAIPATVTDEAALRQRLHSIDMRAEAHVSARKQVIARRRAQVEEQIRRLREFRTNIETNERSLREDENVVVQQRELFDTLNSDSDFIIGNPGPPPVQGIQDRITALGLAPGILPVGWSLDENDLRTLPIDVLIQRINQAHAAALARVPPITDIGWPAANRRPENRLRLMHSMVEARARGAEAADLTRTARLPAYTIFTTVLNITENQLRTLTDDQINQIITNGGGLVRPPAAINNARQEAQSRLRLRNNAYGDMTREFNVNTERQTEAIEGIDFEGDISRMNLAIDLMNRQGEIYSRAYDFAYDGQRILDDTVVVVGDANFTQAERNLGETRGYYEIIDILFDYRNRADRGEYFNKIRQFLPPDRLADLLNNSLGLSIAAPTMANVLTDARTNLNNGQLASPSFRRAFRDIINGEYNRASALG